MVEKTLVIWSQVTGCACATAVNFIPTSSQLSHVVFLGYQWLAIALTWLFPNTKLWNDGEKKIKTKTVDVFFRILSDVFVDLFFGVIKSQSSKQPRYSKMLSEVCRGAC